MVTEQERSIRRRLVFNAMPPGTSLDVLQQCIEILENEFGENPDIRYSQLVKRLGESVEGNLNFGPVLGRIMMMRRKKPEDIGPDPGVDQCQPQASDPKTIVFSCLFGAICSQVKGRGASRLLDLKRHVNHDVGQWELSGSCRSGLEAWAKSTSDEIRFDGELKDLQRIVNESFVWMCGQFGPVETDKILHRAIQLAEQSPEAFEFPPKNFM